jgi:hypothetical protein
MQPYVEVTLRRGEEVVGHHRGHNIWLNTGRQWLRDMLTYSSYSPLTAPETRRIAYIGLGIGGFRQGNAAALVPPLSDDYPGSNRQTDMNPGVTSMERPCRVAAGQYLRLLDPPTFPVPNVVRYAATFGPTDLTYGGYTYLPLSEIGLFLAGSNIASAGNAPVAYDVFDTCVKTPDITMDVVWLISV